MKHRVVSVSDSRSATRVLNTVQQAAQDVLGRGHNAECQAIAKAAMEQFQEQGFVVTAQVSP